MKKIQSFPITWTAKKVCDEVNRRVYERFPENQQINRVALADFVADLWVEAYKYGRADEHRIHFTNRKAEYMKVITAILNEVKP